MTKFIKPVGWYYTWPPKADTPLIEFTNTTLTPEQKLLREMFNSGIKEKDIEFFQGEEFRRWCELLDVDFDILSQKMIDKIEDQ